MTKTLTRLLTLVLLFTSCAFAQSTVTFTASNIGDGGNNKLSSGSLCFLATDNNDVALPGFKRSDGQAIRKPVCAPVANGAVSMQIANTATTSPVNVCFRVTITSGVSQTPILTYKCVQPTSASNSWCSSGTCNFDNYPPNLAPQIAVTLGSGSGVPSGGTTGQALTKTSNADGAVGWSTITASGSVPDANATTKGLLRLTGDLGGTADAPIVPGLASKADATTTNAALSARPVISGTPVANNCVKWVTSTQIGDAGAACGTGGGGAVSSVFSRTGAVTAQSGDYTAAQVGAIATSALSVDGTLASNSDAKVPSEKAVKTYVDAHSGGGGSQPHGVHVPLGEAPATASQVMIRYPIPTGVSWTIATNCANSRGSVETAATGNSVFSLQKCTGAAFTSCTEFGTATFAASGTSATFSCTATSFTGGTDSLKVIAPASGDATLSKGAIEVMGTR